MSKALESALAKAVRRKEQHWKEREPYTREEVKALFAYVRKTIKEKAGTRAQRKAANKAAWAAGDRRRRK